jgi:uncharacterized membrane protein
MQTQQRTESEILKSQMKNYAIYNCVIAIVSFLFFPILLLSIVIYVVFSPNDWQWSGLNVETKAYAQTMYIYVSIPFWLSFLWWMLISLILCFVVIGFLVLILVGVCIFAFMITAMTPFSNLVNAKWTTTHTV